MRDFDAAVHRARVHDDGVGLGQRHAFRRQAVVAEILFERGHQAFVHAFALQAQHDHRVDAVERGVEVAGDAAAAQGVVLGQQGGRPADADFAGAECAQGVDVRARDARMLDVADDQDLELAEVGALALAQGQHVQQALGRVRAAAVAGVDEARAGPGARREGGDRAVVGVAHHETVHAHCLEVAHGVELGFALLGRRGHHVETEDVGAQARRGELEAAARARRGFEERGADRGPGQGRAQGRAAHRLPVQRLRLVEQADDGLGGQAVQGQQVPESAVGVELLQGAGGHAGFRAINRWTWECAWPVHPASARG